LSYRPPGYKLACPSFRVQSHLSPFAHSSSPPSALRFFVGATNTWYVYSVFGCNPETQQWFASKTRALAISSPDELRTTTRAGPYGVDLRPIVSRRAGSISSASSSLYAPVV